MTAPAVLLTQAQAEGVTLALDPPDRLKLRGDPGAVARWAPALRPHKAALLAMLTGGAEGPIKHHDLLPGLYHQWLDGIEEPRALVVMSPDQTRAAMAAGVVSDDVVRASVLLVYRSPLGAIGLLAIPREKYDAFELMRAMEALTWAH